jgi:exosome complex exonuclease RRP6
LSRGGGYVLADARGLLGGLDDSLLARRGSSMDGPEGGVKGREEDAAPGREAGDPEEARDGFQLVSHGKKKKEGAGDPEEARDGFQLVSHGKKKKEGASGPEGGGSSGSGASFLGAGSVRALTKDKGAAPAPAPAPGTKAKVPFHDPTIPRPQEAYKIIVDNYKPFEHVWLERSEDGARRVHPLVSALSRPLVTIFLPRFPWFGVFSQKSRKEELWTPLIKRET